MILAEAFSDRRHCQNWVTPRPLLDIRSSLEVQEIRFPRIVRLAVIEKSCAVLSPYNEPWIAAALGNRYSEPRVRARCG